MNPSIDPAAGFETDPYAAAYPETRPFWAAAAEGRLLLKGCRDCGRAHWYPRVVCPLCGSLNTEWRDASGEGTLYAFSEIQRAEPPCVLAYVRLAEGPTLLTHVVDADAASLRIGQPVRMRMQAAPEGRYVPVFAPAGG
jgi:uncharacterized OB-fold protein